MLERPRKDVCGFASRLVTYLGLVALRLVCGKAAPGDWTFWLPSSAEEGRALAQPAPGWCDGLWKPPIEPFVSQTWMFTRNVLG